MRLSEKLDEIEKLPRRDQPRPCFHLCQEVGIGVGITDRLRVISNGKLTQRLADLLSENAAAIALLLPGQVGITTSELEIVGSVVAGDEAVHA